VDSGEGRAEWLLQELKSRARFAVLLASAWLLFCSQPIGAQIIGGAPLVADKESDGLKAHIERVQHLLRALEPAKDRRLRWKISNRTIILTPTRISGPRLSSLEKTRDFLIKRRGVEDGH
jgi:hypothetical protein